MKRLHVHISVKELEDSVQFYETLFGVAPDVLKPDYAKWQLDDPRVNFAISCRGGETGVNHLGLQVDDDSALEELAARLAAAERPLARQQDAACCYARSNKAWAEDPQGVAWETFHTLGEINIFGEDTSRDAVIGRTPDAASPPKDA